MYMKRKWTRLYFVDACEIAWNAKKVHQNCHLTDEMTFSISISTILTVKNTNASLQPAVILQKPIL